MRNSPSQAKAHDSPTYPGAPVNPTSKNRQTKMSEVVIGAPIANVESSTSVYAIDGIIYRPKGNASSCHNLRLALNT